MIIMALLETTGFGFGFSFSLLFSSETLSTCAKHAQFVKTTAESGAEAVVSNRAYEE